MLNKQIHLISRPHGEATTDDFRLVEARGYRAVGFAGGPDKCNCVVRELGFDACIDYKAHRDPASTHQALAEASR